MKCFKILIRDFTPEETFSCKVTRRIIALVNLVKFCEKTF